MDSSSMPLAYFSGVHAKEACDPSNPDRAFEHPYDSFSMN
jgi:hypothetical protein